MMLILSNHYVKAVIIKTCNLHNITQASLVKSTSALILHSSHYSCLFCVFFHFTLGITRETTCCCLKGTFVSEIFQRQCVKHMSCERKESMFELLNIFSTLLLLFPQLSMQFHHRFFA